MTKAEILELEEIYPAPLKYFYYKDRYLVDRLLAKSNEAFVDIPSLRGSFESRIFQKDWFKSQFLNKSGNGRIQRKSLEHFWPEETYEFDIEVSNWGEDPKKHKKAKWIQTSRSGYNLVLRINLSQEHFQLYNSWLRPTWHGEGVFNCTCHPVSEKRITLGWIRLDMDFDTDEVLIEEIQTDWLRELNDLAKALKKEKVEDGKRLLRAENITGSLNDFWKYYNYMKPTAKIWDELFASAAIWFVKHELQIKNVWMHSIETCRLFKDQSNAMPPKSLYTKLPKKMGFSSVDLNPIFLENEVYLKRYFRKAQKNSVKWFKLMS